MGSKAMLTDMLNSLLSYARALEENCSLRYVDVRIIDLVGDVMSSKFLAANLRAIYIRYVTVCKMTIKRHGVLSFIVKLEKDASAGKALVIIPFHDQSL